MLNDKKKMDSRQTSCCNVDGFLCFLFDTNLELGRAILKPNLRTTTLMSFNYTNLYEVSINHMKIVHFEYMKCTAQF